MEDWQQLSDEELARGFMDTYGLDEREARRQVQLARGTLQLHPLEQPTDRERVDPPAWLKLRS